MSRYELMFGAISLAMICRVLRPLSRATSTNSLVLSENVCALTALRRPWPRRQPDQDGLRRVAVHFQVCGDDDQDRERRNHEDDVREHVQDVVDSAAPVARGEPDDRPDQPREAAADRPDEEGRTQPVDELRVDVLAERRRPEPVLGRGRLVGGPAEPERRVVGEERAEESDREEDEDDAEAQDELPVPEGEVDELRVRCGCGSGVRAPVPVDVTGVEASSVAARVAWYDADVSVARGGHHAPPCIPTRVRGSMTT